MVFGVAERFDVRALVRACRFETEDTGVCHSDVGSLVIGLRAERLRERVTGAGDRVPVECFQSDAPFDKRSMWREERVEGCIGLARYPSRNLRAKAIPAARQRLDVRSAVGLGAKRLAEAGYGLFDAVVRNRHVLPGGRDELIFRQDPSRVGGQL